MNTELQTITKRVSGFSIFLSVLLIICGFLAILLPLEMSLGVVIVIAWLLMISGVFQFIYAFQSKVVGSTIWKILVALAYFITGFYLRMEPRIGLAALTLALAGFLLVQGLISIIFYIQTRKSGVSGWVLFDSIVTLLLGWMIWRHWPNGSLAVIGILVGISMIMTGTTRLMLSLAIRRVLKATGQPA